MPNGDDGGGHYTPKQHYKIAIRGIAKELCMVSDKKGAKILRKMIDDIDVEKSLIVAEINSVEDREKQKQAILAKLTDEEKRLIGVR